MEKLVSRILIENELDVMLAHKRAKQIAEITGLNFADQAKFSAAVSEITRNAVEHGEKGEIKFIISESGWQYSLKAIISDKGKGIENINEVLTKGPDKKGKGVGIVSAKKLVHQFDIQSKKDAGTIVKLFMHIPMLHPPINESIVQGWKEFFENESILSPYEMLKKQNFQLIDALEELKVKNIMIENQLDEIRRLNIELEKNNAEISRLSSETQEKNQQLQKKNNELDEFAYIVTHDLKAPLNNVLGIIDYLENDFPDQQEDFNLLKGQVCRMSNLIHNILSYSRSGKENIEKDEVIVEDLLHEIINSIAVPEKFKINILSELPVLLTEKIYLQQVFSNLICNAIKHHDKEHGNIWISFTASSKAYFEFIVSDDGPGIPKEKKQDIFNLFSSITKNRSVESTGLGLAIIKKIIESKGGNIKVEDNFSQGSRFIFTWPADEIIKENKLSVIA